MRLSLYTYIHTYIHTERAETYIHTSREIRAVHTYITRPMACVRRRRRRRRRKLYSKLTERRRSEVKIVGHVARMTAQAGRQAF